jgi:hypothetical protein
MPVREPPVLREGSKLQVYRGIAEKTSGGLKKKDIVCVKDEKGVKRYKSKLQHRRSKQVSKGQKARSKWTEATEKARKYLQKENGRKGAFGVSASMAKYFREHDFVLFRRAPLDKSNPSPSEKLYIVTKNFYEGKLP